MFPAIPGARSTEETPLSWIRRACLVLSIVFAVPATALDDVIEDFAEHYEVRLGGVLVEREPIPKPRGQRIRVVSEKLRGPGHYPVLLLHEAPVEDVIVLTHGLTDSPYYMFAIAREFYAAGANVVLPLLPAHGLEEPDAAMEDDALPEKWKATELHAVEIAQRLGRRVSLGGFSTGGALSVYAALMKPEEVKGGLFLFSAALDVGRMNELAGRSLILAPALAKSEDGDYQGVGPNPYKYPVFTLFGGLRLTDLVEDNRVLFTERGPTQPIFAVHSIHDDAAMPKGIGDLLRSPGARGVAIVVASNPPIEHASLVLAEDIVLDPTALAEGASMPPVPRANPSYRGMMDLALEFFRKNVQGKARVD